MGSVAHWDEAAARRIEAGPLSGSAQDLGTPAGSVAVGVTRWRPDPGCQTTPAHVECSEEEISFVVAGDGWSWQDGAVCEVRAGDCLVHRIGGPAHTLVAGDGGLDVLAFGERVSAGTVLPRSGIVRLGPTWVDVAGPPHPYVREAAVGPVDVSSVGPRLDGVVALPDAAAVATRRGRTDVVRRDLGRAAGSVRTGLKHVAIAPGAESHPPHVHSAEEELFVVLDGAGAVLLGEDEVAVRTGSVVARPAGTGVAHSFRAGDAGLTLLAYGQRDPRDVCFYPRSRKVSFRAFRLIFRVEDGLDYWDGEE